jgi:ComEC/Rec2-related protein
MRRDPLFFFALAFAIGLSGSIPFSLVASLASLFFFRSLTPTLILLIGLFFHPIAPSVPEDLSGRGLFVPENISLHSSFHKHKKRRIRGELIAFGSLEQPLTVSIQSSQNAGCHWIVEGTLKKGGRGFICKKAEPVPRTWTPAEWRFQLKQQFRRYLKTHLQEAHSLLFSLFTGEIEEKELRFLFSRLGLQHLLAISGFHFMLLLGLLSSLLSLLFPPRFSIALLALFMAAYFLFVGNSPAVFRSFVMAELLLISRFIDRPLRGLNLLGFSLLIELLLFPSHLKTVSLQLSYTSVAAIFLLSPSIDLALQTVFPKRHLAQLVSAPLSSQILFALSSFFRKGLSISLAIQIALAPLLLAHFGAFQWIGILYNLIIPPLLALSMTLLLFALPLGSFGSPLFFASKSIALEALLLIRNPPILFDSPLFFSSLSLPLAYSYLAILGTFLLYWRSLNLARRS